MCAIKDFHRRVRMEDGYYCTRKAAAENENNIIIYNTKV
jgi:hypothetical protein